MYEIKENIEIRKMIYEIRGIEVMLDSEVSVAKWHDKKHTIYLNIKVFIKWI